MPRESSTPLCFRLSVEDRRLVETVAAYRRQTVSDYVRELVLDKSEEIVRSEGSDKILKALDEANSRLREEQSELYRQAIRPITTRDTGQRRR
jgi:uncharacterized protein (DUF1778 family)